MNSLISQNGEAIRVWGTHLTVVNSDIISNSVLLVYMESEQVYLLNTILWHNRNSAITVLGTASLLSVDSSVLEGGQSSIGFSNGGRLRWGNGILPPIPVCNGAAIGPTWLSGACAWERVRSTSRA